MREANRLKSKCIEQEIELEELEEGQDLIDSLKERFNEAHHTYKSALEATPKKRNHIDGLMLETVNLLSVE